MSTVAAPAAPVESGYVSGLSATHRRIVNEYLARRASEASKPAATAPVAQPAAVAVEPAGFAPVPRSRRMAAWVRSTPAPAPLSPPRCPILTGPGTPAAHAGRHPFGTGIMFGEDGGPAIPAAPGGMWTDADEHHAREALARWEAQHAAATATSEPTAAVDDTPPSPGSFTLAGWVASEAARYRALGTLAGELVGEHLAGLAKLITMTQARTPAEAADRLASLDDYAALGR